MAAVRIRNVDRVWQTGTYKVGTPNYVTVSGTGADPASGYRIFDTARLEDAGIDIWADGDQFGVLLYVDAVTYKVWVASWDGTSTPHRLLLVSEEVSLGSWSDGMAVQVTATPTKGSLAAQIARPQFADPVVVTAATDASIAWNGHVIEGSAGSPFTITLPEGLSAMHFLLVQTGAGVVSIAPDTNVTINGDTETVGISDQWKSAYVYTKGDDDWVVLL